MKVASRVNDLKKVFILKFVVLQKNCKMQQKEHQPEKNCRRTLQRKIFFEEQYHQKNVRRYKNADDCGGGNGEGSQIISDERRDKIRRKKSDRRI